MDLAEWWQVLLVFVGIPTVLFAIITVLVMALVEGRVPDGLAEGASTSGEDAEHVNNSEIHSPAEDVNQSRPGEASSPEWLTLREPADAAARSIDLVDEVRSCLPTDGRVEIHDLGCGTGSMARWLAVQLHGPQH